MKGFRRIILIAMCLCLLAGSALAADISEVRGYEAGQPEKYEYQYVLLGTYPYEEDGTEAPLLWRILGREGDQITLFTEYVIDNIQVMFVDNYQDAVKKKKFPKVETFEETDLYAWVNSEMEATILRHQDFSSAIVLHEGCRFFVLSNDEMRRTDWGFPDNTMGNTIETPGEVIAVNAKNRKGYGTPYAKAKILYPDWKNTTNRNWNKLFQFTAYGRSSPYWTTKMRPNVKWTGIIGGNGHISWGGQGDVQKGIRPGVQLDLTKITITGGSGTLEDPWIFETEE